MLIIAIGALVLCSTVITIGCYCIRRYTSKNSKIYPHKQIHVFDAAENWEGTIETYLAKKFWCCTTFMRSLPKQSCCFYRCWSCLTKCIGHPPFLCIVSYAQCTNMIMTASFIHSMLCLNILTHALHRFACVTIIRLTIIIGQYTIQAQIHIVPTCHCSE